MTFEFLMFQVILAFLVRIWLVIFEACGVMLEHLGKKADDNSDELKCP